MNSGGRTSTVLRAAQARLLSASTVGWKWLGPSEGKTTLITITYQPADELGYYYTYRCVFFNILENIQGLFNGYLSAGAPVDAVPGGLPDDSAYLLRDVACWVPDSPLLTLSVNQNSIVSPICQRIMCIRAHKKSPLFHSWRGNALPETTALSQTHVF